MTKFLIVTGAPLTGKTTFIKKNYSTEDFVVLDYVTCSIKKYGTMDALQDDNKLMHMTNDLIGDGMEGIMDNKTIVIEYCTGFEDDVFIKMIQFAKSVGIQVNIQEVTCDVAIAQERNKLVRSQEDYYSSYYLREHNVALLIDIIESLNMTKKFNLF